MKFSIAITAALFVIPRGQGFLQSPPIHSLKCASPPTNSVVVKALGEDAARAERMKEILKEESMNPTTMAESAKRMADMKPQDMAQMIKEMEQMSPAQRENLKSMGMDPDVMKRTMEMMAKNPAMMESAKKMMESMTPEQMVEQSRLAQERMANTSPEQVELAAKAIETLSPDQIDAVTDIMKDGVVPGNAGDPIVIDTMFRTAEIMSQPPTGGVTLQAFASLPPISILSGDLEEDLSKKELAECWADGSLGATRVDRAGFERVWTEVREYFEDDIMEESRKTIAKKTKKRGAVKSVEATVVPTTTTVSPTTTSASPTPVVGQNLSEEQLSAVNEKVKSMSDQDLTGMLDDMSQMSPEQEARMKAMGVDPGMMAKTASMMKNNPMMRKAAEAMMKNMTPEQMKKASEQAQKQMANMSKEDYEKALDRMAKGEQ